MVISVVFNLVHSVLETKHLLIVSLIRMASNLKGMGTVYIGINSSLGKASSFAQLSDFWFC